MNLAASADREIWIRIGGHTLRATADASADLDRWEREPMPGFALAACDPRELAETQEELAAIGRFGASVPDGD